MVVATASPDATPSEVFSEVSARLAAAAALRPEGTVVARLLVALDAYAQIASTRDLTLVEFSAREVIRERLTLRLVSSGIPDRMARHIVHGLPGAQS